MGGSRKVTSLKQSRSTTSQTPLPSQTIPSHGTEVAGKMLSNGGLHTMRMMKSTHTTSSITHISSQKRKNHSKHPKPVAPMVLSTATTLMALSTQHTATTTGK